MDIRFLTSLKEIDSNTWDSFWATEYPFLKHCFLLALEESGAVSRESGWLTKHLTIWDEGELILAMPLYLKTHSYGEYVFDWVWANAYEQHGYDYYPKLLSAIPFTPSTGPRLKLKPELSDKEKCSVLNSLNEAIDNLAKIHEASTWHILFPNQDSQALFNFEGFEMEICDKPRFGCQFHWFNQEYDNFEHFLEGFNARKRKSLKRERRKVEEQEIDVQMVDGESISEEDWRLFYQLYHNTYLKRSGRTGYLNFEFFQAIAKTMPKQILMAQARKENSLVAAALYFRDNDTLYGRYWGTTIEADGLHFECCYYQGIEYAIQHKLQRFDPGAQGEHKIQRGFTPVLTCSFHWIKNSQFRHAINQFLNEEKKHIEHYAQDATGYLPFKSEIDICAMDALLKGLKKC